MARQIGNRSGGTDALGSPVRELDEPLSLTIVYLRAVALLLLAAGLARAALILGITADGQDFSSLTPAWRAGVTTLILVDLFAAVGLWIGAVWGPVMWAVALAVEVSMYTIFAEIFGTYPLRIAAHGVLFAAFLILSILDWRRAQAE